MHNMLRRVFGGAPDERSIEAARDPEAGAAGEAYGPHVRVFSDRFEVSGESFARRDLASERVADVPAKLRAALRSVVFEPVDAQALIPGRHEVFLHITPSMAATLRRIADLERNARVQTFVLLTGPTGSGKTTTAKTYCHLAGEPVVELTFSGDTTLADFFRRTEVVSDQDGQSTVEALGPAVRAMRLGHKLLINEINMLPPDLLSALTQAMDTGRLVLSGTDLGNIEIEVHERFGIFATANPNYVGTAEIGRALRRRFGLGIGDIPITFLPAREEIEAVAFEFDRQPLMRSLELTADRSIVERLVGVATQLRGHDEMSGQMRDRVSTRSLVHWLSLSQTTGLPLAEVGETAVLSIAPDEIYPQVVAASRRALGSAQVSGEYPKALRSTLLAPEPPDPGAAVAVPEPLRDHQDADPHPGPLPGGEGVGAGDADPHPSPLPMEEGADGEAGVGAAELTLDDGRRVRIVPRAGRPPRLVAHEPSGAPITEPEAVRRALRAEYGLNLVRELGHVPAARETLACLTRSSWTAIRLAQGALLTGRPVFLRGPTGCGKSALARTLARLWELPILEFSFTGETSKADLTATRRLRGGATEWSVQAFLEAAARGLLVIVNEYNLAYPDVHSIVNGLFDKGGRLLLPDGREIRAHPDFRLVATGYPEGPGVKPLNEGVENRFGAVIRMTYPPKDEELAIVNFVAEDRLQSTTLASAVEIATISRQILDGTWDAELRHPLSKVPADLAASVAERTALTTAELVALARASDSTEEFVAWYRRGVIEGAAPEVERVLRAALTAYGLA